MIFKMKPLFAWRIYLGSALLLFSSLEGYSSSEPLSLLNCYSRALEVSESVAIQKASVDQAEEALKQAWGGVLPTLSFNASRKYQQELNSSTGRSIFPSEQNTVALTLNQPLFRGMREFAALRQGEVGVRASEEAYHLARVQLYKDVARAYFDVLSAEQELKNFESEVSSYQSRMKELDGRIKIGRSRVGERLTVESALASLASQIESAKNRLQISREILAFQIQKPSQQIQLKPVSIWSERLESVDYYLAQIRNRPDVRAELEKVRMAQESVKIAEGARLPNLDLVGGYYFTRPGVQKDSKWDLLAQLSFPFYTGGVVQSKVREARSKAEQSELQKARVERIAEQELRSAYSMIQSDIAQWRLLNEAFRIAEKNYAEQSKDYRFGLVSNLEVLQALIDFQQAHRNLDRQKFVIWNDWTQLQLLAAFSP